MRRKGDFAAFFILLNIFEILLLGFDDVSDLDHDCMDGSGVSSKSEIEVRRRTTGATCIMASLGTGRGMAGPGGDRQKVSTRTDSTSARILGCCSSSLLGGVLLFMRSCGTI